VVETKALKETLREVPHPAYLFGSRADDAKKGGDVDVLILAPGLPPEERLTLSLRLTARFQNLCDEKVDFVVLDPARLAPEEDAFLTLIRPQTIPLAA
jgi:predicted nucleotidyltransferase